MSQEIDVFTGTPGLLAAFIAAERLSRSRRVAVMAPFGSYERFDSLVRRISIRRNPKAATGQIERLSSLQDAAGAEVWHFASTGDVVPGSLREAFQAAPIGALNFITTPYCGGERWQWILPGGGAAADGKPVLMKFPATRSFRTTLTIDAAPPDDIAQEGVLHFLSTLFDLKTEIDERADDLFEYRGLRCLIEPTARVNMLRTEQAAAIIMAIADRTESGSYVVAGEESLSGEDFLEQIGDVYGVSLLPFDGKALFSQRLTAIDALFDRRLMDFADHLGQPDREVIEHAYSAAGMNPVQSRLDPATFEELVQSAHRAQLSEHGAIISDASKPTDVRKLKRGDRELSYRSTGSEGAAVVLINALGQGPKPWSRLIAHLRPRFRVLSWDPHGLDESEPQLSLLDHVADLASIIERESLTRVHLVAWCTGPKIAAEFAMRYPDRVLSMTFLNMQVKCLESAIDFDTPFETEFQAIFSELEQRPSTAPYIAASLVSRASDDGLNPMIETEADESEAVLGAMSRDLREPVLLPVIRSQAVHAVVPIRPFRRPRGRGVDHGARPDGSRFGAGTGRDP